MPKYFSSYLTITLPNGEKTQKRFRGKTQEEADAKKKEAEIKNKYGLLTFNDKTPFERYAEEWRKLHYPDDKDVERRISNHLTPVLGALAMGDIKSSHIEKALSAVKGTSKSNIDKTYRLLSAIFKSSVNDDMIVRNPMTRVDKPKGTRGSRRSLTETEQQSFRTVLQNSMEADTDDEYRRNDIIFGITYACGLRPGEARALSWSNVYFGDKPYIKVSGAVKKDSCEIGATKTENGLRTVIIPDWFAPYLEQYKKETRGNILLFPALNKKPINEQRYKKRWISMYNRIKLAAGAKTYRNKIIACADIGDDLTPYYLRHTFCTNTVAAGVTFQVVQYFMGHHVSNSVTDIYTHITDEMIETAREQINAFWNKKLNAVEKENNKSANC